MNYLQFYTDCLKLEQIGWSSATSNVAIIEIYFIHLCVQSIELCALGQTCFVGVFISYNVIAVVTALKCKVTAIKIQQHNS